MDVVDLTDSYRQTDTPDGEIMGPEQNAAAQRNSSEQPRRKLGPQAAAAMQAGTKRKLPDSFRPQPPAQTSKNRQKAPVEHPKAQRAVPPLSRQPGMRITAQVPANSKAAANATGNIAAATLEHNGECDNSAHLDDDAVNPLEEETANKVQTHPGKSATQAKRRLPESWTAPDGNQIKARPTGARASATVPAIKAGPSEHDTKAALRAALEGLQISGGKELDAPAGRMAIPLMRHQRMALAWMLHRERSAANPMGGILADDQGLGKTISTIALIVTNQRGDDVADEGLEDQASDSEEADPDAVANADAAVHANIDAAEHAADLGGASAGGPPVANGHASGSKPSNQSAPLPLHSASQCPGPLSASVNTHQQAASSMNQPVHGHTQPASVPHDAADAAANKMLNGNPKQNNTHMAPPADHGSPQQQQGQEGQGNIGGLPEGGTLIICPTAVLNQWHRELDSKVAPPAGMTVYMYHGKQRGIDPKQLSRYACVLTTYTTMGMEAAPKEGLKQGISNMQPIQLPDSDDEDHTALGGSSKGKNKAAGPLFQIYWWRVVLDESQAIKNVGTLVAHASHCLQAGRRWCLSGTPIQNSVDDLYSCFRFLRYDPYCKRAAFKAMLKEPLQDDPAKGAQLLQICLKPVLLRRTKSSTIDGEPVVKLPPREQQLVRKAFSHSEQQFYDEVQAESMQKLKELEQTGGSYVNMLWLLLRLRQACNHPWLVHGTSARYGGPGAASPSKALGSPGGKVSYSQLAAAKKLAGQLCEQLLQTLQQEPSVCAQCGDISEDAVVSACHHVFCRQCITMQVGALGGRDAECSFQCPTCAQPLSAAQVFTAPALRKARGQAEGAQPAGGPGRVQGGWQSSSKVEHLLELLRAMQHRGVTGKPPGGDSTGGAGGSVLGGRSKSDMRLAMVLGGASSRRPTPATPAPVTQEKIIVFSQWTSMLDLVETALRKEKFVFRRLDGSMSMANRDQAIIDFQEKPGVNILIVSLKAAALGLNLVAANHVVLLDLWWNPTIEEQAIDRAHRIGQTRTVHVTRITIAGTVEERILALQDSKRKIVSAAFGDEASSSQQTSRLTKEDLHFLFTGQH